MELFVDAEQAMANRIADDFVTHLGHIQYCLFSALVELRKMAALAWLLLLEHTPSLSGRNAKVKNFLGFA